MRRSRNEARYYSPVYQARISQPTEWKETAKEALRFPLPRVLNQPAREHNVSVLHESRMLGRLLHSPLKTEAAGRMRESVTRLMEMVARFP